MCFPCEQDCLSSRPYRPPPRPNALLRLFADVGEDAAVHVQNVPVDEVRSVGSQEHGGTLQVLGRAPTGGRRLGNDELIKRMTAAVRLRLAQRRGLRRGDVAGPNAIALDIGLAKLGADVLGLSLIHI